MDIIHQVTHWIRDHQPLIEAVSAIVVATFTLVLAWVAWRQNRDARILQRAYITVQPGGIKLLNNAEELISHFTIENAGNLPATRVQWESNIELDAEAERSWFAEDVSQLRGAHLMTRHTPELELSAEDGRHHQY